MAEYYEDVEFELYNYDSPQEDCDGDDIDQEVWQDLNSEELLNLWMSIVEYHEMWYLPLNRTFNQFCEFVFDPTYNCSSDYDVPEIQAIKTHPWIKDLDWDYFFSLNYK